MEQHAQGTTIDLREYLQTIAFRKWTIVLTVVLLLGSVLFFSFTRTPIYEAEAKVLVKALPSETGTVPGVVVDVPTQAEIISSEAVASLVKADLNYSGSITQLLDSLSVESILETQVVGISYSSSRARFAQNAANAFAENYLEFRQNQGVEEVGVQEEAVQDRVDAATEQLNQINLDLQEAIDAKDEALAATLETSRSVLLARLGVLQQELDDLRSVRAAQLDAGEVIEPATFPGSPVSPNHITNGILGLLLGLTVGVGLAFLRERLDDRFKDRAEVERVMGAPVLATIPRFPTGKKAGLITLTEPDRLASESYRSLRTNLQFIASQREIRSVLITSPSAGDGKTITAGNLAVVLAQAGQRVILVSADLRRPTLEHHFDLAFDDGLSTWLMDGDRGNLSSLIKDPGIKNIRLIPCGQIPPNPAELLASPRLAHLIKILEENCDLVIVDSPPILAVADSAILANHMGGALLVTDAATAHRSAVIRAKEELERVGGDLIGCVFNGFDSATSPYYYYHPYSAAETRGGFFGRLSFNGRSRLRRKRKSATSPEDEKTRLSTSS